MGTQTFAQTGRIFLQGGPALGLLDHHPEGCTGCRDLGRRQGAGKNKTARGIDQEVTQLVAAHDERAERTQRFAQGAHQDVDALGNPCEFRAALPRGA